MDPIQFDQLPDLCLRKIFTFLSLRDLVRCRTVNRQFKHYADRTQVTELVVYGERGYSMHYYKFKKWFETDRSIDFESAISMDTLKFAKSSHFNLNQKLKFLHLSVSKDSYSAFRALGSLKQLVHLEIRADTYSSEKTRTLALPNLRIFAIESRDPVILKTPKLEALRCVMNRIQIEYPKTIKRVECLDSHQHYCGFGDLPKLSSLETLHVELSYGSALEKVCPSDFPDLKELHIMCSLQNRYGRNYEELQSLMLDRIHEKNALQRDELKLYLNDVLLVEDDQLLRFNPMLLHRHDPEVQIENCFKFMNYRLLRRDSYPEITYVYFNQLMRLDFEISEDFFDRFPQIQELTASGLVDRDQLEWFLQNVTALSVLKLTDTRLDQTFVDGLPKLCSRLTRLKFNESSDLVTNFQFLLQFEQLEMFETNRPLHQFDLASTAFRQLAKLKSLQFRTGWESVNIEREIKRPSLEDNYSLRFFRTLKRDLHQTLFEKNLSWSQLEALYEQRRRSLVDEPEKMMRIKRARLE